MKRTIYLSAVALCAAFLFASCEKSNTGNNGGNENEDVVEITLPETMFYGYYDGDYYEAGTDNVYFTFVKGDIGVDDMEEYIGTGELCYVDINIAALSSLEEKDHAQIPVGTYTLSSGDYAAGTINGDASYVVKVENDVVSLEEVAFTGGTVKVEESALGRKISVDVTLEGGVEYKFEYEGPANLFNNSEETKHTNLTSDVKVGGLSLASMACLGNLDDSGKNETWVLSIGDKYYDLESDYGLGQSILIYLNLEPELEALPSGHFDTFVDMMDEEVADFGVNTLISGVEFWGLYAGCWYTCPALTLESSLVGGSLDIKAIDENGDGINEAYEISGSLKDAYGKTVEFSYNGKVVLMEYADEEVKSASGNMVFGRKIPYIRK